MESMVLMHWCLRQRLGPVGLTGISMGGHMASLACCSWPRPVPLIPCLSWTTASGVFTQGVLSGAVNWQLLTNQYFSNQAFRDELFNLIHSPEGHFSIYHEVGQNFARTYPAADDVCGAPERSPTSDADCAEPAACSTPHTLGCTSANVAQDSGLDSVPDVQNSFDSQPRDTACDLRNDAGRPEREALLDNESSRVKKNHSPDDESIFLTSQSVNSSPNGKTDETFYASSSKASNVNIENCSENSGFSHLDAQSNDLNAFSVVSTKKQPRDDVTPGCFDSRSSSSCERSFDFSGGSSYSIGHSFISGESVDSSGTRTGTVPANPSAAMASASAGTSTSGVFTSTKPTSEKFSRGLLTSLNPLNIIRLKPTGKNPASKSFNSEDSPSPVSDAKKLLKMDGEGHPKQRLDLLLGRYLKESTQKIISSSSSLFSRASAKSGLKDDPHLGFTPVGIRPASSQHQNMVSFKPYFTVKDPLTWEAVQFMRGIMDECTHVANFGHPTDTELIIIIQATKDAYEPNDTMTPLDAVWPGAELRTVDTGHIEAFLLHHQLFREAVRDAFLKAFERYRLTEDWTQGGKPCIPPDEL